jgi:hypothetical protein
MIGPDESLPPHAPANNASNPAAVALHKHDNMRLSRKMAYSYLFARLRSVSAISDCVAKATASRGAQAHIDGYPPSTRSLAPQQYS